MKYYTITVNGTTYNVSVEEGTTAAPAPSSAPRMESTPAPAPAPAQEKPAAAPSAGGSVGDTKVSSPMPGKIISIKSSIGHTINKGEVILVLEAMKMENEIVAPQDGIISSIDVAVGQSVEAGTLLATLN